MAFASPEVETCWSYVETALDGLIEATSGLDAAGLAWTPTEGDSNSLYVLAYHTMGSIEEAVRSLAGQDVGRDREAEFRASGASAAPLAERWASLRAELPGLLEGVEPAVLERTFEYPRRGSMSGRDVLVRATTHASEHRGQAELTRQLLNASAG